jgi:hypothetical protein
VWLEVKGVRFLGWGSGYVVWGLGGRGAQVVGMGGRFVASFADWGLGSRV